jgi:hypothetical protein
MAHEHFDLEIGPGMCYAISTQTAATLRRQRCQFYTVFTQFYAILRNFYASFTQLLRNFYYAITKRRFFIRRPRAFFNTQFFSPDIVTFSKKMLSGGIFHRSTHRPKQPGRIINTWVGDPHKVLMLEAVSEQTNLL